MGISIMLRLRFPPPPLVLMRNRAKHNLASYGYGMFRTLRGYTQEEAFDLRLEDNVTLKVTCSNKFGQCHCTRAEQEYTADSSWTEAA